MKRIPFLVILSVTVTVVFISCRGGETKADPEKEIAADTHVKTENKIPDNKPSAAPVAPDSFVVKPGSNEILSKIDQYLVSKPVFTAQASGDIVNATVTVRNTLKDITFQKAIVQVTITGADGKELGNDFYTIQNIEPGDIETIKLPTTKGTSLKTRIVKVKSNALTNGEMVLTGPHFDGSK